MLISLVSTYQLEERHRDELNIQITNNFGDEPESLELIHEYTKIKWTVKLSDLEELILTSNDFASKTSSVWLSTVLFYSFITIYLVACYQGFGVTLWTILSGIYIIVLMAFL
jgi:hypothetical protein